MLRRPATTIKLTPEDILEYDDTLAQQQAPESEHFDQYQEQASDADLSNITFKESRPEPTRDERIGVSGQ